MTGKDWFDWHADYDEGSSTLARRLVVVQERLRAVLDECPAGPIQVISICAGQGRDLLGVLETHPRREDVTARLVELDPRNASAARRLAETSGLLPQVEVRVGDAALIDQYVDWAPADVVLLCGVFGNISDRAVERTIGHCAALCKSGAFVVWTRHRRAPDLVPRICRRYDERNFALRWLSDPGERFGVGIHQYAGQPQPLVAGARMFAFEGS